MKAPASIKLAWPMRKEVKPSRRKGAKTPAASFPTAADFDKTLYEALKEKRRELAQKRGDVPAYAIFPNRTLESLAVLKPLTIEEALELPGIRKAKAHTLLPAFLKVIAAHYAESEPNPRMLRSL